MLKSQVLEMLRQDMERSVKEAKVASVFFYKPGDDLHRMMTKKISATERIIEAIYRLNEGSGSSEDVCDAIDGVLEVINETITLLGPESATPAYAERAQFLGLKSRFQRLEELLVSGELKRETGDEYETEPDDDVVLN